MVEGVIIKGRIVGGLKQGAFFTQLDWVRDQCRERLGFAPYPGTLNIEVDDDCLPAAAALRGAAGRALVPPDAAYCSGKVFPAVIRGVSAAIVIPATAVRSHADAIVEVIAAVNLKETLQVDDGDTVTLTLSPLSLSG